MEHLGTCSFNYNEKLMVNGLLAWIPASPKIEYQTTEPTEPTNFPFVDSFFIPDKKYTPQKISMEPYHPFAKSFSRPPLFIPGTILEPKWGGSLFWLEFRPCFEGLTFRSRSLLGFRYTNSKKGPTRQNDHPILMDISSASALRMI